MADCAIALRWMPHDFTDDKPTLVQVMTWCRQATSLYLNQCRSDIYDQTYAGLYTGELNTFCAVKWYQLTKSSKFNHPLTHWGRVTHICVGYITITYSDRSWSAPSHYLNQCWYIVNWALKNKLYWNLSRKSHIFIQENAFEIVVSEMASFCFGLNVLTWASLMSFRDDVNSWTIG